MGGMSDPTPRTDTPAPQQPGTPPGPRPAVPGVVTVYSGNRDDWSNMIANDQADHLRQWMRDNDADPVYVTVDHAITIEPGPDGQPVIRYTVYLRDSDGHLYRDPDTDSAAVEQRTTPVLVPYEQPAPTVAPLHQALHNGDDGHDRP